jgi:small subunit ribosomal protein S7
MSRRRQAVRRPVAKDAKFNSTLVSRLVNTVMERGKKSVAQRIVYGAFDQIITKNPAANPLEVLQRAVDNVPAEVKARGWVRTCLWSSFDRQMALAMRWLVDLADTQRRPHEDALPPRFRCL